MNNTIIFHGWTVEAFPPLSLFVVPDLVLLRFSALTFFGISVFFLLLSALLSRGFNRVEVDNPQAPEERVSWWSKKVVGIQQVAGVAYLIASVYILSPLAKVTVKEHFVILAPILEFFLLQVILLLLVLGSWFRHRKKSTSPLGVKAYLRANHWQINAMYSPFFVPFILFSMPLLDARTHIIYVGAIVCVLLLYFVSTKFIFGPGIRLFRLAIAKESLSPPWQQKFNAMVADVPSLAEIPIQCVAKGVRNAFAVYPDNKIIVGVELLEHLSVAELQGVILHELGHLKDSVYLPAISRSAHAFVVLYLVYQIVDQAQLFPSSLISSLVMLAGIFVAASVFKRLRLRAEFVADSFVKAHSAESHKHLLAGIEKLSTLNGVDRDFCKKQNYGHLDLDEREEMVAKGKFGVKRKSLRAFWKTFVPTFCIGVGLVMILNAFMPSDEKTWKKMHSRYYQQQKAQKYMDAQGSILEALEFTKGTFGKIDPRSYRCFNDLVSVSIYLKNYADAEHYAREAVAVGEALYQGRGLRQLWALDNLAWVLTAQENWSEVEGVYLRILALQLDNQDSADEITHTFSRLLDLSARDQNTNKIEEVLSRYFDFFKGVEEKDDGVYLIANMLYGEQIDLFTTLPEVGRSYFSRAIEIVSAKYGPGSSAHAYLLADYGSYLVTINANGAEAEKLFEHCFAIYEKNPLGEENAVHNWSAQIKSMSIWDMEGLLSCLTGMAKLAQQQKNYLRAKDYLLQALLVEEELSGEDSIYLVHHLKQLYTVYKAQGDMENCRQTMERVIRLEEALYVDKGGLLADYKTLLDLLHRQDDGAVIEELQYKIKEIEKEDRKVDE